MKATHWSTVGVEQAHASLSITHKFHHKLGCAALQSRSFLHQARPLFQQTSIADKYEEKLKQQITNLRSKQPQKIGARHVFLQVCYDAVRSQTGSMSQQTRLSVMKKHGVEFSLLDPKLRQTLELHAVHYQQHQAQSHQDALQHCLSELALNKQRESKLRLSSGVPLMLRSCRFGPDDLMTLSMRISKIQSSTIGDLMQSDYVADLQPPSPLEPWLQACLEEVEHHGFKPEFAGTAPLWSNVVCRNRETFHNCCLVLQQDEVTSYYLVLFAMKKPFVLQLACLERLRIPLPSYPMSSRKIMRDLTLRTFGFSFRWLGTFADSKDIGHLEWPDVLVIPNVRCMGSGKFVADGAPMSFTDFLGKQVWAQSCDKESHRAAKPKTPKSSISPDLLLQHPWLADHIRKAPTAKKRSAPNASKTVNPANEESDIDNEAMEHALDALKEKRAAWATTSPSSDPDFETHIRGGKWTVVHRHEGFDCIVGRARHHHAQNWCKDQGLQVIMSFSYKKYGNYVASELALEWVNRMQHFYSLSQDLGPNSISQQDVQDYVERASFTEMVDSLPLDSVAWPRIRQVRSCNPRSGGASSCRA